MDLYSRWWEDFPSGLEFETRGITVTETHVVNWSALAGDWLPLHVDHEHARDSLFGEPVAHGPLTLALALGLVTQSNVFGDAIVAWLGLDEVRLPAPVRIGDTIRVRAVVGEQVTTSKPERGRVSIGYQVLNQRDETVMRFDAGFLMKRKSGFDGIPV